MTQNTPGNFQLKSLNEIPESYRCIFRAYPCLNYVQSSLFDDIFHSSASVVVTAPTGSGKTLLFELAIIKMLIDSEDKLNVKAVYIAPTKALCYERYLDWGERFEEVGISCLKVTGDNDNQVTLDDYQLILTTPEKWDALTRKWTENVAVLQKVKLLMIDEVHLLGDPRRGPVLETIVCRTKTMARILKNSVKIRFIAVSATIANIEDLAAWLDSATFRHFGNEVRPVVLNRVVKGFPQIKGQSPFLFDIYLSFRLKNIILGYADKKPALIFCSTRRGVLQTAKTLSKELQFNFSAAQMDVLRNFTAQLSDNGLRDLALSGISYHHAGMSVGDRSLVQEVFMNGWLPVLVATSTLAMGVNLPAHLVVIKSTHQYVAGKVEEYPESSILQMVGRAGRPQFDSSATAVIMTRSEMVTHYENLLDCKEILESSLHLRLTEHLNAEIVLHAITDLGFAMDWLRCSFLHHRVFKNPKKYGITAPTENPTRIEKELETTVLREINALSKAGLVELNDNGIDVAPTADGRLMSHYYISFHTFCLFSLVEGTANLEDLVHLLAKADELQELQLRVNERRALNELNVSKTQDTIRFRIPGKITTTQLKIVVLAQACLDCLTLVDSSLKQESVRIVSTLERLAKCLSKYLSRKRNYCSFLSAVIFAKCLYARLWENSKFVARQLPRIGPALGANLVACGKTSFAALENSHPHELEQIINRGPPMGNMIIQHVRHLPQYSLKVDVNRENLGCSVLVTVSLVNAPLLSQHSTAGLRHYSTLIVGDSHNHLLHQRKVNDSVLMGQSVEATVALNVPLPRFIYVHVISEQWVGFDLVRDVMIDPLADATVKLNCHLPCAAASTSKVGRKKKQTGEVVDNCTLPLSNYWEKGSLNQAGEQNTARKCNSAVEKEALFVDCCFDLEPSLNDDDELEKVNEPRELAYKSQCNQKPAVESARCLPKNVKRIPVNKTRKIRNASDNSLGIMQRWLNDYDKKVTSAPATSLRNKSAANSTAGDTAISNDNKISENVADNVWSRECSLDDGQWVAVQILSPSDMEIGKKNDESWDDGFKEVESGVQSLHAPKMVLTDGGSSASNKCTSSGYKDNVSEHSRPEQSAYFLQSDKSSAVTEMNAMKAIFNSNSGNTVGEDANSTNEAVRSELINQSEASRLSTIEQEADSLLAEMVFSDPHPKVADENPRSEAGSQTILLDLPDQSETSMRGCRGNEQTTISHTGENDVLGSVSIPGNVLREATILHCQGNEQNTNIHEGEKNDRHYNTENTCGGGDNTKQSSPYHHYDQRKNSLHCQINDHGSKKNVLDHQFHEGDPCGGDDFIKPAPLCHRSDLQKIPLQCQSFKQNAITHVGGNVVCYNTENMRRDDGYKQQAPPCQRSVQKKTPLPSRSSEHYPITDENDVYHHYSKETARKDDGYKKQAQCHHSDGSEFPLPFQCNGVTYVGEDIEGPCLSNKQNAIADVGNQDTRKTNNFNNHSQFDQTEMLFHTPKDDNCSEEVSLYEGPDTSGTSLQFQRNKPNGEIDVSGRFCGTGHRFRKNSAFIYPGDSETHLRKGMQQVLVSSVVNPPNAGIGGAQNDSFISGYQGATQNTALLQHQLGSELYEQERVLPAKDMCKTSGFQYKQPSYAANYHKEYSYQRHMGGSRGINDLGLNPICDGQNSSPPIELDSKDIVFRRFSKEKTDLRIRDKYDHSPNEFKTSAMTLTECCPTNPSVIRQPTEILPSTNMSKSCLDSKAALSNSKDYQEPVKHKINSSSENIISDYDQFLKIMYGYNIGDDNGAELSSLEVKGTPESTKFRQSDSQGTNRSALEKACYGSKKFDQSLSQQRSLEPDVVDTIDLHQSSVDNSSESSISYSPLETLSGATSKESLSVCAMENPPATVVENKAASRYANHHAKRTAALEDSTSVGSEKNLTSTAAFGNDGAASAPPSRTTHENNEDILRAQKKSEIVLSRCVPLSRLAYDNFSRHVPNMDLGSNVHKSDVEEIVENTVDRKTINPFSKQSVGCSFANLSSLSLCKRDNFISKLKVPDSRIKFGMCNDVKNSASSEHYSRQTNLSPSNSSMKSNSFGPTVDFVYESQKSDEEMRPERSLLHATNCNSSISKSSGYFTLSPVVVNRKNVAYEVGCKNNKENILPEHFQRKNATATRKENEVPLCDEKITQEVSCCFDVLSQNMSQPSENHRKESTMKDISNIVSVGQSHRAPKRKVEEYLGRVKGKLDLEAVDVILANVKMAKAKFDRETKLSSKW